MPYIYVSKSWYAPEGQTTSCEDWTAPPNVCRWINVDTAPDIRERVDPLFGATRDLMVSTNSTDWTYTGHVLGPPAEYFGGAYDEVLGPRPDAREYNFDYRSPPSKWKGKFEDLKARGEILLGNRLVYDIKVTAQAGIPIPSGASPVAMPITRRQNGAFPFSPRIRCWDSSTPQGVLFPSAAPGVTKASGQSGIPALNNVFQYVDRYKVPDGSKWSSFTLEEITAFVSNLESTIVTQEMSVGLITQALADANQSGLDVLTTLGEAPETIRLIHQLLKQIVQITDIHVQSMKDAKRLFYKAQQTLGKRAVNVKQLLDQLASIWLQWRYAVMPLVYTAEDALKALSALPKEFVSTRKRTDFPLDMAAPEGYVVSVEGSVRHRCFIKRRYNLALDVTKWRQVIVADVPTTIWELTKLSFVVDWALNVGDFLASLNSPPGVDREKALYSRQFQGSVTLTRPDTPGKSATFKVRLYSAALINPSAHNGLDLHLHMTWKRELDAIALAWSLFRSSRKRV